MTDERKPGAQGGEDLRGKDNPDELAKETEQLLFKDMAQYMSQFARSFEASARRWELVVYPSMLAFIILAAYGFFLIYKLTSDIDRITVQMEAISVSMVNINKNFSSTTNMTDDMDTQNTSMRAISESMERMNTSIDTMAFTVYEMRMDTATMGRNLHSTTGPMRFMNSFMPW
jgi:methyl-accepting chemotaxis protein